MSRRPPLSPQENEPLGEAGDQVYPLLEEKGLKVDRNVIDVTEARRLLATCFGVSVCLPYGHAPVKRRSPLYTSKEVEWDALESICSFIENSGSLRRALARPGMPDFNVFYGWLGHSEAASERYARARVAQGIRLGQTVEDIAEDLLNDPDPSNQRIAAARVAGDQIIWAAGKLAPVVYGTPKQAIGETVGGFVKALERIEASARKIEDRRPKGLPVIDIEQDDQ